MKKNFNFKLTIFLVGLFVSLIVLILGNKNSYCLSFGFVLLGVTVALYVWYNNEKMDNAISEINQQIDEINEEADIEEEEHAYIVRQLLISQNNLIKKKKKVAIVFYTCGILLALLGFIAII